MKDKKNILYDLQLSVLTNLNDGDFIFQTDSNVNVASFLLNGLVKKNHFHYYVLVPPAEKLVMLDNSSPVSEVMNIFTGLKKSDNITLLEYPYYGNPFVDRMSFNSKALSKALGDIHIDLVYTNDPCKVLSYKTFFYHKQNEFLPIVTRNHWVTGKIHRKVPEEIDFVMRQVEGSYISEFASYNSQAAKDMMIENAKEFFNDKVIEKLERTGIVTETVDSYKVDRHIVPKKPGDKFTILFAHRLSYYTGWEEVFDALKELHEEGLDFQLVAPDPGNKFTQKELKEKYPFLLEIDKDTWNHAEYLRMCWKADIAVGNHNIPTTWGGLALTEPMAAKTVPLMPRKDGYLEMFYSEYNDEVFFDDMSEFKELVKLYYESPEVLKMMKREARRFVDDRLSMDDFITSIDNTLTASLYF